MQKLNHKLNDGGLKMCCTKCDGDHRYDEDIK
jgi:hypothetical protein